MTEVAEVQSWTSAFPQLSAGSEFGSLRSESENKQSAVVPEVAGVLGWTDHPVQLVGLGPGRLLHQDHRRVSH
jgi:hypothetical protein